MLISINTCIFIYKHDQNKEIIAVKYSRSFITSLLVSCVGDQHVLHNYKKKTLTTASKFLLTCKFGNFARVHIAFLFFEGE